MKQEARAWPDSHLLGPNPSSSNSFATLHMHMDGTKNVLSGRFGADRYLRMGKHVINTMLANIDIFKLTRCDN